MPWAEQQVGASYPIGGGFWPHGQIALRYGLLRPDGVADRAMFLIERAGWIRFKELYAADQLPPVEPVMDALRQLWHEEQGS